MNGRIRAAGVVAALAVAAGTRGAAPAALPPVPQNAQTAKVRQYLLALESGRYADAYALLNPAARAYYRSPENFASVYAADGYRITAFRLLGARGNDRVGRVFFARETARFRDHAHDVDLVVTANVPVGVVPVDGSWSIKDPGHPWRAFAARASGTTSGVQVTVKKMSFFERRIEAVVTVTNSGPAFVTVLPYGRSLLRDSAGRVYRPLETRDWSLTDKTFFEGLRLAPGSRYTGLLAFGCDPLRGVPAAFSLTVAPLLTDGADAPFSVDVDGIAATPPAQSTAQPR